MSLVKVIPYFFLLVLAASCATISAPSGGEKDTVAPKPIKFYPENQSLNFSSQSILIEFDEFIALNSPKQNIIVSPPLEYPLEVIAKGKSMTISFKDTLRANTTYNFFFAGAVKDFTEGNDTTFSYVVSTGPEIDSLSLSILVKDAFTAKPQADVWVLAYDSPEAGNIDSIRPLYLAKTNKTGMARLEYLANKPLWLYALSDLNGNLNLDLGQDKVGFVGEQLIPGDSIIASIRMYTPPDTSIKIVSKTYDHPGLVTIVFNKECDLHDKILSDGVSNVFVSKDTMQVFLNDDYIRKGNYSLSIDNGEDTLTYTFYIPDDLKENSAKLLGPDRNSFSHTNGIRFKCARPIVDYFEDKIHVNYDTVNVPVQIELDSNDSRYLWVKGNFIASKAYNVRIEEGAVIGTNAWRNDSLFRAFNTYPDNYFGKISYKGAREGLLQLTKEEAVVWEGPVNESSNIVLDKLFPGKYQFRLIEDLDGDERWTSGNHRIGIQPETVYYYPEEIDLRTGWDVEIDWQE